jgi:hypothetical protein
MMRQVARDESAKEAFLKDPEGFLGGRDLTEEERKALIAKDFRTLYALGVHSFVLFGFVMSIFPGDRKKLEEEYCKTIAPLGRIDYST